MKITIKENGQEITEDLDIFIIERLKNPNDIKYCLAKLIEILVKKGRLDGRDIKSMLEYDSETTLITGYGRSYTQRG